MRSDPLKKGINAAPQRALLKALGLCDAEIERPLIGVVSSQNDIVPGHVFLDKITDAVKQGVALGGGVLVLVAGVALWRYHRVAVKQFGGITGDLAGWFLQKAELYMLAALVFCQWKGLL